MLKYIKFIAIFCQLLFFTCLMFGQSLSAGTADLIVGMLHGAELDSLDLNFDKDWDLTTKFKLPAQINSLQNPWTNFALVDSIIDLNNRAVSASNDSTIDLAWLTAAYGTMAFDTKQTEQEFNYTELWNKTVTQTEDIFTYVNLIYSQADVYLQKAFEQLTISDKDSLNKMYFQIWSEADDADKYAKFYLQRGWDIGSIELKKYATLIEKVDFKALLTAGMIINQGMNQVKINASKLAYDNQTPLKFESQWGLFIIGTKRADYYTNFTESNSCKRIAFILDPSGDDVYNTDIYTDATYPYYYILDLEGNDTYLNQEIGKLLCVFQGIGISIDCEGNNTYRSDDFALCSFLGVQMHLDEAGNDIYSGGLYTQGAAMFGLSLLIDLNGNDLYSATSLAQGMGSTKAVAGLYDFGGNDVYYIGGKYLHTPLAPFDYRSMGQGMGFGMRPDYAGGFGILFDKSGNDRYSGGVYAQGVGYWYAVGLLIDLAGNDYYDAVYYPQGSGIHLATGILYDGEGDDHYYSKNGPGQGAAHDWGTGLFIDKAGNDTYSLPGGNGLALTNSVALFIDCQGDDRYERKEVNNYGYANFTRETGGIGIFLDSGGNDVYPDTLGGNNKSWQRGTYGLGKDIDLIKPEISKTEALALQESADIDTLADINTIYNIACEWEVGSAIQRVRKARDILFSREAEAVDYIIHNRMSTDSGLEYRVFEVMTDKSALFRLRLKDVLQYSDSLAVKNAISLIASTADSTVIDTLLYFLHQNKYIPTVINSLGLIKHQRSIDAIKPYLNHPSERYRYIASRSLKLIGLPQCRELLNSMKDDKSFLVRALIRNLPPEKPDVK